MPDTEALRAEAANPATTPARLAELAAQYPELQATIVENPSTYPGLLEWLGQYGNADAAAAIARRSAPQPPAFTPSVPAPRPPATTPGTPGRPRRFSRRTITLAASGAGVIVIATIVVIALVVVGGATSITNAVAVVNIDTKPHLVAWPNSAMTTGATKGILPLGDVGSDEGLFYWTDKLEDGNSGILETDTTGRLSLVNTATGVVGWTVAWPYYLAVLLSVPNDGSIVVGGYRDAAPKKSLLAVLDLANGSTIRSTHIDGESWDNEATASAQADLDGDFLVRTSTGLSRFSSKDLTHPKWTIKVKSTSPLSYVAGVISSPGDHAWSLATGDPVTWKLPSSNDLKTFSTGGHLVGSSEKGLFGISSPSEPATWTRALGEYDSVIARQDGLIVYFKYNSQTLICISATSGKVKWSSHVANVTYSPAAIQGENDSSPVALITTNPSGSDTDVTKAFDITTGKTLYQVSAIDNLKPSQIFIESSKYLYGRNPNDGSLKGLDLATGSVQWSISVNALIARTPDVQPEFDAVGGQLLAFSSLWSPGDGRVHKIYTIVP